MAATNEQIAVALFTLLSSAVMTAGAATTSRRLLLWSDVPTGDQPALFLAQGDEHSRDAISGDLRAWTMDFKAYVYIKETDKTVTPATKLNLMIQALKDAVAPSADGERQTLGGLVQYIEIPEVITDEGTLGDQAVAVINLAVSYAAS